MRALALICVLATSSSALAATYYVRATSGNDAHDGRSPGRALRTLSRLSRVLQPGDTAYVGPGLYRDNVQLNNFDTPGRRTVIVADSSGRRVTDPAGLVIIAGSEPVDPDVFEPGPSPGTYTARLPPPVHGVVEMDGTQARYLHANETTTYVREKMPESLVVGSVPSTFHYDPRAGVLAIHTSDGRPPASHRIEIIRRRNGFFFNRARHVTVEGFVLRHSAMAGIEFFNGSDDGLALRNVSFGHHQGIQVHGSRNVRVVRNVLFRNVNAGVYFLSGAGDGIAAGNVAFENLKGVRLGSESDGASILENHLLRNDDAGLSVEHSDHTLIRRNSLTNNGMRQLFIIESAYDSDQNCFATSESGQAIAAFFDDSTYERLDAYQRASHQDVNSCEGACAPPAPLPDVHHLAGDEAVPRRVRLAAPCLSLRPTGAH